MSDPAARASEYVREAHRDTVETVLRCADAVASEWRDGATTEPSAVAGPLRAELEARGTWSQLPDVLAGAVRATDRSLPATPVAEPPYVTATSRGPMLRATLDGGRLVVLLQTFAVERDADGTTRYVRGPKTPRAAIRTSFE